MKLGRINNQKISDFARIPLGDMEKIRLQIDPKNFMELKKYVNKYRDKLVIKSNVKMTMVDKLENKKASLAREDEIDFDFTSFKEACLSNRMQKFDNKEILKLLKTLKLNLVNEFLNTRQV